MDLKNSDVPAIKQRMTPQEDRSYPEHDAEGKFRTTVIEKKDAGAYKRETMKFPIIGHTPREGKRWQLGEEEAGRLEALNRFFWDGNKVKLKIYDFEDTDSYSAQPNLLLNHGSTDSAAKAVNEGLLGAAEIFDNPKPIELITHLINIGSESDSIIVDFFSGSGTTAHAVMQLNAEDGGSRRFIGIQIDEATDPSSEAHKAGYSTIFDITKARITKAATKIQSENPKYQGDLGFKIFETKPIFDQYLDAPDTLTENLTLFDANKLSQEDRHSLMRTWALRDNIKLTIDLKPIKLADYTAYSANKTLYFIEPNLSLDAIIVMLEQLDHDPNFAPNRLVVLGYLLDTKVQREMTEALHHYNNRKGIELTLDIRYN
jgi:adenine-specific DNA-methyltransferase